MDLKEFEKYIKKKEGTEIINADEKESYGDVIPCSSFSLRTALGIGGFAKRKIYTVDGDLSAGKSTTSYDIIAQAQKKYSDLCLLIDKEDSYTTEYGKILGIDNERLKIVTPHTLEDMYDVLITAIESGLFGVIVVDSVTAFAPQARYEGSERMGLESQVNSDKMRLVANSIQRSNTCLILIQQIRQTIGGMGDPTVVSGGKAIPFYAHCRIRVTRSEIDRDNKQNVIKFTIIKNKMAEPFKVSTIVFKWGKGFDFFSEVGQLAVEFGIIRNEGKSYYFPETDYKVVGKKAVYKYLEDNEEYTRAVIEPRVKDVIENQNPIRLDEKEQEPVS